MERFGPTRRGGPVFRWLGEALAIDLANTVMVVREGESVDLLDSSEALETWLDRERPRLGDCRFALPALAELRAAREDIRALFAARASGERVDRAALDRVNAASRADPVAPELELTNDDQIRAVDGQGPIGDVGALLGAIARSAIELVARHEEAPLGLCDAPSCGMFFVGRRRWCCAACGNRARAARHYRNRRAARR